MKHEEKAPDLWKNLILKIIFLFFQQTIMYFYLLNVYFAKYLHICIA